MQAFVDRFRYKASKARQAQSRLKALERMPAIEIVVEDGTGALRFPGAGADRAADPDAGSGRGRL